MTQQKIWNAIFETAGNVDEFPRMGWHFVYKRRHYFYIKSDKNDTPDRLRICIPHLIKASVFKTEQVNEAINQTNQAVKYVKVMLLSHGSISLNYDHKIMSEEPVEIIIPHIIQSLDFAADYLLGKLGIVHPQ